MKAGIKDRVEIESCGFGKTIQELRLQENGRREDVEVLGNRKKSKTMPDYRQEVHKNEKTQITQVVMESQKKQKQR